MNKYIKEFFSYSKWERRGILVLITLIFILAALPFLFDAMRFRTGTDFKEFDAEVSAFILTTLEDSSELEGRSYERNSRFTRQAEPVPELFPFDPNQLAEESWKRLGLKDWQIKIIKNFENKGGKFRKKEDVQHMYGMKEELYERLEPFIQIKEQIRPEYVYARKDTARYRPKPVVHLDLASADSVSLIQIGGIGPSFASRIVKYRNRLGGFYRKEQLMEVFGMDSGRYEQVSKYLNVEDTSRLKKININTILIPQLNHPYLSFNQVNALVNYRRMHGKYKQISDIRKTLVITPEVYARIRPYLSLE
jgi:competence protein ComEA